MGALVFPVSRRSRGLLLRTRRCRSDDATASPRSAFGGLRGRPAPRKNRPQRLPVSLCGTTAHPSRELAGASPASDAPRRSTGPKLTVPSSRNPTFVSSCSRESTIQPCASGSPSTYAIKRLPSSRTCSRRLLGACAASRREAMTWRIPSSTTASSQPTLEKSAANGYVHQDNATRGQCPLASPLRSLRHAPTRSARAGPGAPRSEARRRRNPHLAPQTARPTTGRALRVPCRQGGDPAGPRRARLHTMCRIRQAQRRERPRPGCPAAIRFAQERSDGFRGAAPRFPALSRLRQVASPDRWEARQLPRGMRRSRQSPLSADRRHNRGAHSARRGSRRMPGSVLSDPQFSVFGAQRMHDESNRPASLGPRQQRKETSRRLGSHQGSPLAAHRAPCASTVAFAAIHDGPCRCEATAPVFPIGGRHHCRQATIADAP